jgi:hypothetical protein
MPTKNAKKPKPIYCRYGGKKYPVGSCINISAGGAAICQSDGSWKEVPGPCDKKAKTSKAKKKKRKQ